MKKFWLVRYLGVLPYGGTAVVAAKTADEAIAAVATHRKTTNFSHATAVEVETPEDGVLYNDNGDY